MSEFLGGFQIFGKFLLFVSVCGSKNVLKKKQTYGLTKKKRKGKEVKGGKCNLSK